jgi:uncharacterized membrane protein
MEAQPRNLSEHHFERVEQFPTEGQELASVGADVGNEAVGRRLREVKGAGWVATQRAEAAVENQMEEILLYNDYSIMHNETTIVYLLPRPQSVYNDTILAVSYHRSSLSSSKR